jgi:hypothetical protein
VFENRVLRRIFGPKRDEETGKCRKLHNKELNDLHPSPIVIWMIILRRMRLGDTQHIWGERRGEVHTGFGGEPVGMRPLGRPGTDGRIILRWICKK